MQVSKNVITSVVYMCIVHTSVASRITRMGQPLSWTMAAPPPKKKRIVCNPAR